jgi:hypothetical protein
MEVGRAKRERERAREREEQNIVPPAQSDHPKFCPHQQIDATRFQRYQNQQQMYYFDRGLRWWMTSSIY